MKKFCLFIFIFCTLIANSQSIVENGWFYPKHPCSDIWGYPVSVTAGDLNFIGSTSLSYDSTVLVKHIGPNYTNVLESSLRYILLGDLYKNDKHFELKIKSKNNKRWTFDLSKVDNYDVDIFYPIEGLSADSLELSCKVIKDGSVSSKSIEKIIKKYLKTNTAAFTIVDILTKSKPDTLKGLFELTKKDTSEFKIRISNPNVIYAVKLGKITQKDKNDIKKVQWGEPDKFDTTFAKKKLDIRLMEAKYNVGDNNIFVYVNIHRNSLRESDANSPTIKVIIDNKGNSKRDTITIDNGQDIGGIIHFEDESNYSTSYNDGKDIFNVAYCYNIDYDIEKRVFTIEGLINGYNENAIYRIDKKFEIFPSRKR